MTISKQQFDAAARWIKANSKNPAYNDGPISNGAAVHQTMYRAPRADDGAIIELVEECDMDGFVVSSKILCDQFQYERFVAQAELALTGCGWKVSTALESDPMDDRGLIDVRRAEFIAELAGKLEAA